MVVVCLAPADLRPEVDDLTGAVRADSRRADAPASEWAALEHGLRVAEAWGGWVLAVAAGPAEVDTVLAEAIAVGATAVRVDRPGTAAGPGRAASPGPIDPPGPTGPTGPATLAGDGPGVAAALAAAILSRGRPALVLCGDRSAAVGVGAVPALLADALGIDQALGLVSLKVTGPGRLAAQRRLDAGWRERLHVTGPAVLSVEGAGVRLRRASLAAALAAGPPEVFVAPAGPTGPGAEVQHGPPRPYRPRTRPVPAPVGDAHERLLALTGARSEREPPRVVGPVDPAQAADELLAYLRRSGPGEGTRSGTGGAGGAGSGS